MEWPRFHFTFTIRWRGAVMSAVTTRECIMTSRRERPLRYMAPWVVQQMINLLQHWFVVMPHMPRWMPVGVPPQRYTSMATYTCHVRLGGHDCAGSTETFREGSITKGKQKSNGNNGKPSWCGYSANDMIKQSYCEPCYERMEEAFRRLEACQNEN